MAFSTPSKWVVKVKVCLEYWDLLYSVGENVNWEDLWWLELKIDTFGHLKKALPFLPLCIWLCACTVETAFCSFKMFKKLYNFFLLHWNGERLDKQRSFFYNHPDFITLFKWPIKLMASVFKRCRLWIHYNSMSYMVKYTCSQTTLHTDLSGCHLILM